MMDIMVMMDMELRMALIISLGVVVSRELT